MVSVSTTAQLFALTCYGNAFLQGTYTGRFLPNHSTCYSCDRIRFVRTEGSHEERGGYQEPVIADTPDEWFELIKANGAIGLRLHWATRDG
jgi:hypothetical protein